MRIAFCVLVFVPPDRWFASCAVQDSSLPVGVFVWHVENSSNAEYEISISFVFKNGQGTGQSFLLNSLIRRSAFARVQCSVFTVQSEL